MKGKFRSALPVAAEVFEKKGSWVAFFVELRLSLGYQSQGLGILAQT
jgi:hypothetical protein